ncbi:hypothetical protein [Thermus thermophilus]|uniref:hypothetical protein n=1 Tax=Thermus thermophilus TaxID=274 RepID=UPI00333F6CFF
MGGVRFVSHLAALFARVFSQRRGCPVCGLPKGLAREVRAYRRHCPQVAFRACPYDPRRGLWRQRR